MAEFRHGLGTLEPWIHHHGVAAVFLILVFESFGVPLPGESLLVFGAILAERGDLSFPGLLVSAWTGAMIGDNAGYAIGRILGQKLVWRYGGKVGLTAERLHKVEVVFARYGSVAVAFARFFNVLRQLNGVVAGTVEMDWRRFLVFNALGGALWVLIWTMVGYYLGIHGSRIAMLIHKLGLLGVAIATIMLMAFMTYVYGHKVLASLRRSVVGKIKER